MTDQLPEIELRAVIDGDGTGTLEIDGVPEVVQGGTEADVRALILARATERARVLGRPLLLTTRDPGGEVRLVVSPSGEAPVTTLSMPIRRVAATGTLRPAKHKRANDGSRAVEPGGVQGLGAPPEPEPTPEQEPAPAPGGRQTEQDRPAAPAAPSAPGRRSFLEAEPPSEPPTRGWRATAARMGMRVRPSAEELAERADIRAVSRHWAGPRTIAVVNGKGGANKTPTTALLAAVFARYGGAGVLAWDNNETRGTLGWRTEQGPHEATVHDLLPHASELLAPEAEFADLARYVHHQSTDKYDVLRSNPRVLADQQRISRDEFDALHKVARKYYRLLFLDSGNDESADRWQQMIERAGHLVIATTALGEHAEAGALLLEQLAERDARSAELAERATVVVSQSDPNLAHGDARTVASRFRSLARAAVTIPFDDALHSGRIHYEALARPTQRSWLAAAAAVAAGLDS